MVIHKGTMQVLTLSILHSCDDSLSDRASNLNNFWNVISRRCDEGCLASLAFLLLFEGAHWNRGA